MISGIAPHILAFDCSQDLAPGQSHASATAYSEAKKHGIFQLSGDRSLVDDLSGFILWPTD